MGAMTTKSSASSNQIVVDSSDSKPPLKGETAVLNQIYKDYNQMYSYSRTMIRSFVNVPRDNQLENIQQILRRQSKALTDCFRQTDEHYDGIVDMVTERLNSDGIHTNDHISRDYHVPSTNYENVGRYISSNNSIENVPEGDKHKSQKETTETIHSKPENDGIDVDGVGIDASVDVM
ncbi:uncharacterized protein LOC142230399 [Haematobia irritans]|uniref:uncharacterized protein LOC142230399 n=1 Tax=Haematobia irritans TaxID=7368 RepID=UPI003F4F6B0B